MPKTVFTLLLGLNAVMFVSPVWGGEPSSSDLAQARQFLSQLPEACSKSSMYFEGDGTVAILLQCSGNGQEMSGIIKIKDGVVTQIRDEN